MRIINGKLINAEHNQLDQITQRCQTLETQIAVINQRDYPSKLQQISQEVNHSKTCSQKVNQEINRVKLSLQQAEKKINNLERICQQQRQQLTFLKTAGIISMICLSLFISCTSNNNNKNSGVRKYSQLELSSSRSHNNSLVINNSKKNRVSYKKLNHSKTSNSHRQVRAKYSSNKQ